MNDQTRLLLHTVARVAVIYLAGRFGNIGDQEQLATGIVSIIAAAGMVWASYSNQKKLLDTPPPKKSEDEK